MYLQLPLFVVLFCYIDAWRFDYTYSKDAEGWLKLHQTPATWHDAYLNCYYEGGILASPENEKMRLGILSAMANNVTGCGVYTGIHATFGKGAYFSVTGTPLARMPIHWAPDEPNNEANAEDCLIMLPNGEMGDVKCSEPFPYLCYLKKTKDLNACGTVDDEYTLSTKTGSCYKVHRSPLNWTRAFVACAQEGGYLAIINSATEAQVLVSLWEKTRPYFVAGKYNRDIAFLGFRNFENHFLWMTIHAPILNRLACMKNIMRVEEAKLYVRIVASGAPILNRLACMKNIKRVEEAKLYVRIVASGGQTITAAGYDLWASGQPDQFNGHQECGAMFRNGQLDDNNCENTLPFICEKDPESLLFASPQLL